MRVTPAFVLACALVSVAPASAAPAPDFEAAHGELVTTLKDLIRINTTNPPGGETKAAVYLQELLKRDGIASEIFERDPGRGNLVARLKGNGSKPPLLLMGHVDTVPAEVEKWSVDPFAAVEKDGYLYGRGASDMKTGTMVFFQVFRLLHRLKVPLDRDVIMLASAAEELSIGAGIQYMVGTHWDKIAAEFCLNEGGITLEENGRVKYVAVSAAEKVPRRLFLTAKGESGHGSRPRPDNAVVHLAAAVAKVGEWQPPMRLNEITRTYFERLAKISPPGDAWLYAHLEDPAIGPQVQEILRRTQLLHNAMLRTSISPTVIRGGFQANVIPGDAMATLDIRALPDEDMAKFADTLRRVINDPAVEVTPVGGVLRPATAPSPLDSDMMRALERAQQKVFPEAVTLPQMDAFATDSAELRAKGVKAYGISPVMTREVNALMHGNDERVRIAPLKPYLEFVWTAVAEVAGTK
jgi:acetylornithine deacetylase/succinyl-diaminopimelate desuccinylase-like protein